MGNIEQVLMLSVDQCKPLVVLVHCGVNNLSKTHKYRDEFHQMSCTFYELGLLVNTLRMVQSMYRSRIILSQCLTTRNSDINARATLFNKELLDMCRRGGWYCVVHENICEMHLRDTVHLNEQGRLLFIRNLMGALEHVM